jgi:DNA-binding NtrC family response regulator
MPTARAATARLIICERSGDWAIAWKRLLSGAALGIAETRSLAQCGEELAASPASVVALEIRPDNLSPAIAALVEWSLEFPSARFIAISARGSEALEPLAREAGALYVVYSPVQLSRVVPLVRRHLARAPQPAMTLREAIWARLPWAS